MKSRLSGAEAQPDGRPAGHQATQTGDVQHERHAASRHGGAGLHLRHGAQHGEFGGTLAVADRRRQFRVEGDGFLWRQDDSFLTISNHVAHGDRNRPGNEHWIMKTVCLIALMAVAAGLAAARPVEHERRAAIAARDARLIPTARILTGSRTGDVSWQRAGGRSGDEIDMRAAGRGFAALGRASRAALVAETNVVMDFDRLKGQPIHATGDQAVYDLQCARRRDE